MRILFAGSPEIAVPALEAAAERFQVVGVLTNPDSVQGRGRRVLSTPVKSRALELGIPVLEFDHLYRKSREAVSVLSPDLLVTFAYGRIFGPKFLALFPRGGVNVHPSLLPKLRGSSPIQAAILRGEEQTGITIQEIALEMDTGDILSRVPLRLDGEETTASLSRTVSAIAPGQLIELLERMGRGETDGEKQNDAEATYCSQITREDGEIDWNKTAVQLSREIRAYNPWPKSRTGYRERQLFITYALPFIGEVPGIEPEEKTRPGEVIAAAGKQGILVATGKGALCVKRLQLQAKKEMDWKSFMNGNPGFIGSVLSS